MRTRRRTSIVAVGALLVGALPVSLPSPSQAAGESSAPARLVEVDRLPVFGTGTPDAERFANRSGWLLLNRKLRRGYQLFETNAGTVLQSFDLDTLAPRRRIAIAGMPVTAGIGDASSQGVTSFAGEVVWAVDEEAGRLYLALSSAIKQPFASAVFGLGIVPPDEQRPLDRVLAIDERAFDRGAQAFAATFTLPVEHARFAHYWLESMQVNRSHVPASESGKLLLLFAEPTAAQGNRTYDHTLLQWNVGGLALDDPDAPDAGLFSLRPQQARRDWERRLDNCQNAPLASFPVDTGKGNLQWGVLVTTKAIYVSCQFQPGSGMVVAVSLDADGRPVPVLGQQSYLLSKPVADILVDQTGGRLLLKTIGPDGASWWVFDGRTRRFAGSLAAMLTDGEAAAYGLDPASGRLYALIPDHRAVGPAGEKAIRGGLQYADTRLSPVPALENVDPSLAYPGVFRIQVDQETRRVFVRRGHVATGTRRVYPALPTDVPAPLEPFYRVFEDRIPVPGEPLEPDDSVFTADVPEARGRTRASYLGGGAGYGTRVVLTGGLSAVANRMIDNFPMNESCRNDDREVLAGSVGAVSVSDLSVEADAAGLDADSGTQDQTQSLLQKCSGHNEFPTVDHLAFDADGDGVNDHRASCLEQGEHAESPRDGFRATVTCDRAHDAAEATATGQVSSSHLDSTQNGAREATHEAAPGVVPDGGVRIGHASSTVTVKRRFGEGITVTVDSVARDVEIGGVGRIGVVRMQATSKAGGRRATAGGDYERTVCGVQLPTMAYAGCLSKEDQRTFVKQLNEALAGYGEARVREPDPKLLGGSPTGYQAAVQRDRLDLFADAVISRDTSLAVPGLELVLNLGDGSRGAGRQIVQLAGVRASTSFGVVCLYGPPRDGACGDAVSFGNEPVPSGGDTDDGGGDGSADAGLAGDAGFDPAVTGSDATDAGGAGSGESLFERLAKAPFRLVEDLVRLLFASPRELGLMAALWALLYVPCYLGERRRALRGIEARRFAVGGSA